MARYNKTFTVRATEDSRLEVFQDGRILYRLGGDWRQRLLEWQRNGWTIVWS